MKALILGISGQDGAYLGRLLLNKGYEVYGTSRDAQIVSFQNLKTLGIIDKIHLESVTPTDFRSVFQALTSIQPDEVYNLAGQTSVGLSFKQPVETFESIGIAGLTLLEAIRFTSRPMKYYNACSSECFGDIDDGGANENTPFRPRSPYAAAKAAAFWQVANYREAYGMFACSGILFNHESSLRPERFVTQKITSATLRIASGSKEKLNLGNISIRRDWGWAPEYVEAMWLIMQQKQPDDFVIATGQSNTLEEFIDTAFSHKGLNWQDHVKIDPDLMRPTDLIGGKGNASKAWKQLGWEAKYKMKDVVHMMMDNRL
jgi:GDPmannose 4,6-dehydratase